MSISVIIPSKDRKKYLQEVLSSYLGQPEVGEVIVINDGSSDGTLEYLKQVSKIEPKLRYIDNGINKGIPVSKNIGIKAAKSKYLFLGEDDLELGNDFFKTLLSHMHKNSADIICGRNIWRFYGELKAAAVERTDQLAGEYVNKKEITLTTSMNVKDDSQELMLANPMLGLTSVFREIMFDERYKVNFWREETDFQISAQEAGYKLYVCPHAMCFNYIIEKDRGGVHAAVGFKRAKWVIINNWRFIRKHKKFIAQNFEIGNLYTYITLFAIKRIYIEVLQPILVMAKAKIFALPSQFKTS